MTTDVFYGLEILSNVSGRWLRYRSDWCFDTAETANARLLTTQTLFPTRRFRIVKITHIVEPVS